ncbi:hypothetical protein EHI42_27540 [Rhizobium hidalgonense]|nr:hypothetical protein EHI42_27540 [Rhizobium hidalgonense]
MNTRNLYWAGACAHCHQGRLIFQNDVTHRRLYVHCEECEWGWLHPSDVGDAEKGFLTLLQNFDTGDPTLEEIQQSEWRNYLTGSLRL